MKTTIRRSKNEFIVVWLLIFIIASLIHWRSVIKPFREKAVNEIHTSMPKLRIK